jgi:putative transposase
VLIEAAQEAALSNPPDLVSEALGVSRSALYVQGTAAKSEPPPPRADSPRALSLEDRESVRDILNSERFADQAPAAVYATLLDEGVYVCSVPTMYRILRDNLEVQERRQRKACVYHKPELLATGPNQVWSWDITKLLGPEKWTYFYLYVIMDVFSRYIVGWMIAPRESAALAEQLIAQTCLRENIKPGQLTIHADRGSAMTSKPVALLLADLGVTKTHSRPHVSNDNPYSEAQFKTLKYRPDFPGRFGSIQDARGFCRRFLAWYNQQHRHSGIAMMTPESVHLGRTDEIMAVRQRTLTNAYERNPERFVRKPPVTQAPPKAAWINPPVVADVAPTRPLLRSPEA